MNPFKEALSSAPEYMFYQSWIFFPTKINNLRTESRLIQWSYLYFLKQILVYLLYFIVF